jgi:hypothetical protein
MLCQKCLAKIAFMLSTLASEGGAAAQTRRRFDPAEPPLMCAHPGPALAPRVVDVLTPGRAHELRMTLPPGVNVGAALHALLGNWPPSAGCGRIAGGVCSRIQYHVMGDIKPGPKPYGYGPPITCCGASTLVTATLPIGHHRADGSRILHCHGGFVDQHGTRHGGHLVLEQTIAAGDGVCVHLSLFKGVDLITTTDAETAFDLLQPVRMP